MERAIEHRILRASVAALVPLAWVCHYASAADLFVSPEGNDGWTGTLAKANATRSDGPLASLVGARDAIRRMKASGAPPAPICVHVRSGDYAVLEPLVFEPQDSGTEQYTSVFPTKTWRKRLS